MKFAMIIDAVGGNTLASILPQMKYRGTLAACGLAGGAELNTTVIPFLLRGVKLLGIDSVMCPFEKRRAAIQRRRLDLVNRLLLLYQKVVTR